MSSSFSNNDGISRIRDLFIAKYRPAYINLDKDMRIQGFSANIAEYGYEGIEEGQNGEECLDFMVGMDTSTEIELPLLLSPSGHPVEIKILPDKENLTVFIMDAHQEYAQLKLLQQKANEVELLSEKQQELMHELGLAKSELELKNKSLEESSRLQSTFISGVSHEFRTPLTSIIGYANRIKSSKLDAEQTDQVGVIQRSAKHLLSLVENLLDHGRAESNELLISPGQVALKQLLDDIYSLMKPHAESKKVELIFDNKIGSDVSVLVDETRLQQCLINIVSNAIKFTDRGKVQVSAQWQGEELIIKVADTGPGIKPEDIDKIFLSFWQGDNPSKPGAGLGLTITKRLVDLMGGEIQVESTFGKGSEFLLSLPLPEIAPGMNDADDQQDLITITPSDFHILLVEDDTDISVLVQLTLQEYGFKVSLVEDGMQAVERISKSQQYDLILMDINMPVMDGYTATSKIRKLGYKSPILAMTASNVETDKERAINSGCDGYIIKPIDNDELLSILNDTLTKK